MATGPEEALPRRSAEFVESSVLEAVVPSNSAVDIEEELGGWDRTVKDESAFILPFLQQRQVLLFDEIVPVYVVFRTPVIEEATLKSYLARLAITLEAFIFSTAQPNEQEAKAPPPRESVFSETIKDTHEPTIVRHEGADDTHFYVLWKLDVFISRPRGRFMKPAIYFQSSASLKPAEKAKQDILDDEYLPSRVPTALNLLQSFEHDPALAGIHPRLSALRISKIAPTAPVAKEMVRPIRNGQRPVFRVLPALIWRVRYSKVQTSLNDLSLLAQLDMEAASVTGCSITIKAVSLSLRGGHVKAIVGHEPSESAYKPGDQLTYLYKIAPDVAPDGAPIYGTDGHSLTLNVKAAALISADCRPNLFIEWKTGVDFTAEFNPDLIKAAHRLSNPTLQVPKAPNPDALPSHDAENQAGDASTKTINVTLTISGPPQVKVGEMFQWEVFIVNRSDKIRKLAVLVIPKRKRDYERHRSHPSTSSIGGVRTEKKELLAHAIVDENVVYGKQKSAKADVAELICLTPDIRMGHLAPGACYTGDMKFLALSSGHLSVECVRVIDLITNETSDIRDLPNIIAVDGKE